MKCKFCGNESSLIEAHVIPAGFFRRIDRPGKKALEMLTNKEGEQKKRLPIVVYDKTIVCKNCENIWAEWDNYAQQLLATTPLNGQPYYIGSKQICYVVHDYDYRKLKLFFISVLWRHPFLARISFQGFLLANLRI